MLGGMNLDDQEYEINGTIPGMIKVLQEDFDVPLDEAKFYVYILLSNGDKDAVNAIDRDQIINWYMSENDEKYECRILDTHLVISFSSVKQNVLHLTYSFLSKFFFGRDIDLMIIGSELIYLIATSIKKIEDTDYCVYARIIENSIGKNDRFFDLTDIYSIFQNPKCDFRDEKWTCPYLGRDDDCTCNKEKVNLAIEALERQGIIKKVGERWVLNR